MFYVVTGGSGSGKSEYAENLAVSLGSSRVYIATMQVFGEEGKKRVARHRKMREGKQFVTVECPVDLDRKLQEPDVKSKVSGAVVLLECMSNLLANEMFRMEDGFQENDERAAVERILAGVKRLRDMCSHLVLVTNEVFSDGIEYEPETMNYIRNLGRINRILAGEADEVAEVVCGIPVIRKQRGTKE